MPRDIFAEYADTFFRLTPIFRYVVRGGRGRKLMLEYRKMKGIRRPKFATSRSMFKGYGV